MKLVATITAVLALALMHGVAGAQVPQNGAPPAAPNGEVSVQDSHYRLGPGDKIHISTFGEDDLTGDFFVGAQGVVSLPLIGDVAAAGKTVSEFNQEIAHKLAQGYINNPSVTVEVLTYRPFYILGEVSKPGEYPYESNLTVLNAAATAGGFTYRANQHRVMIKHVGEAQEHSTTLTSGTPVAPGDTIRVLERYF